MELAKSKELTNQDVLAGRNVQYIIRLTVSDPLPILTELTYNGRVICSGPTPQPRPGEQTSNIRIHHTLTTRADPLNQPLIAPQPGSLTTVNQKPIVTVIYDNGTSIQSSADDSGENTDISYILDKLQGTANNKRPVLETPVLQQKTTTHRTTTADRLTFSSSIVEEEACGNPVPSFNSLAVGGTLTKRGEWPWMVAMFKQVKRASSFQLDYFCTGTLISKNIVITAAHCIRGRKGDVMNVNQIQLHIGQYNVEDLTESGMIIQRPRRIIPHPDYRIWDTSAATSDADIAIIQLREQVKYSQFIRSACLWTGSSDLSEIAGKQGLVAGWGRDETGQATTTPNKVSLQPVTNEVCIKSNRNFEYIVSSRTFCAGAKDGTGPCNGDSGAGWLVKMADGRWYLRGIVSSSLADPSKDNLCDLRNYVVFTDCAKFMDWIKKYTMNSFD